MQVRSPGPRDFMWVFSKTQNDARAEDRDLDNDMARIFAVKVTNTLNTGAVGCRECPVGAAENDQ